MMYYGDAGAMNQQLFLEELVYTYPLCYNIRLPSMYTCMYGYDLFLDRGNLLVLNVVDN